MIVAGFIVALVDLTWQRRNYFENDHWIRVVVDWFYSFLDPLLSPSFCPASLLSRLFRCLGQVNEVDDLLFKGLGLERQVENIEGSMLRTFNWTRGAILRSYVSNSCGGHWFGVTTCPLRRCSACISTIGAPSCDCSNLKMWMRPPCGFMCCYCLGPYSRTPAHRRHLGGGGYHGLREQALPRLINYCL